MKWKFNAWKWAAHKFASGRFAGTNVSNRVATDKTSPLVTRGFGHHPRYLVLGGWTVGGDFTTHVTSTTKRHARAVREGVQHTRTGRQGTRRVFVKREADHHGRF